MAVIDTLKLARRLTAAGMPQHQAEEVSAALGESIVTREHFDTCRGADREYLETARQADREYLEAARKADREYLDRRLAEIEAKVRGRMIGQAFAIVGAVAAIVGLAAALARLVH